MILDPVGGCFAPGCASLVCICTIYSKHAPSQSPASPASQPSSHPRPVAVAARRTPTSAHQQLSPTQLDSPPPIHPHYLHFHPPFSLSTTSPRARIVSSHLPPFPLRTPTLPPSLSLTPPFLHTNARLVAQMPRPPSQQTPATPSQDAALVEPHATTCPAEDLSEDDDLLSYVLVDQLGVLPTDRLGVHPQQVKFVGPKYKKDDVLAMLRKVSLPPPRCGRPTNIHPPRDPSSLPVPAPH